MFFLILDEDFFYKPYFLLFFILRGIFNFKVKFFNYINDLYSRILKNQEMNKHPKQEYKTTGG